MVKIKEIKGFTKTTAARWFSVLALKEKKKKTKKAFPQVTFVSTTDVMRCDEGV